MHDTMNFNDIKSNLHIVAESCEKVDVAGPGCNVQQGQAILKQKAGRMKTERACNNYWTVRINVGFYDS